MPSRSSLLAPRPGRRRTLAAWLAAATAAAAGLPAARAADAEPPTLALYSARHYPSDEALFDGFTRATGIRLRRVDGDDAGIVARLKAEGSASPADVVLLVDGARLWRAEADGLLRPIRSAVLEAAIPAHLRGEPDTSGAIAWFGLSTRARVIVYDKQRVDRTQVARYEQLADPRWRGQLCTRSGAHPYNLSLFASQLDALGPERTEAWLKGLVANLARPPVGGDTDQIRAVASGECRLALSNSYYVARMMRSSRPEDVAAAERIGVVFPDQDGRGTHVNIAGAAVARHSRQPALAQRFIEYLASPEAQAHFANGNHEWPAVAGARVDNPALKAMGGNRFRADSTPVARLGQQQAAVQRLLDRVGFP